MLRRMSLGLVLLIVIALVGGCLGQEGEPSATPTTTDIDPPTSTPVASTANVLGLTSTPCDDCPDEGQPPATDTPAPALADNELRLADFKGQVVLVNFWATW